MESTEPSPPPSLWRNRDFMALWTGETVSTLGSSMSFLVFPLVGLALTGSALQAALIGTAYSAASTASRLPAGVLVDRWNRKRVMVTSNALGAVLYASLGAALLLDVLTLTHLIVVAFATGIITAFFAPAESAALRTIVPREQLPTAYSQNEARQHVAGLVGPPLGGALYALTRWLPFAVDAVTYAASALSLARIREPLPAPERRERDGSLLRELTEGVRFLLARRFFRAYVAFAALANFSIQALFLVIVLKLATNGVSPAAIGSIQTALAAAGIAGALAAPRLIRHVPSGLLAIGTGLLIGVAVVPMAFTDSPWRIGLLFAIPMLVLPAGNAAISAYVTSITPDHMQGRAASGLIFCATIVQPLGPLVGGLLLHLLGGRDAMLVTALLTASAVVPLLLSREVRHLSTPDRWPEPEATDHLLAGS